MAHRSQVEPAHCASRSWWTNASTSSAIAFGPEGLRRDRSFLDLSSTEPHFQQTFDSGSPMERPMASTSGGIARVPAPDSVYPAPSAPLGRALAGSLLHDLRLPIHQSPQCLPLYCPCRLPYRTQLQKVLSLPTLTRVVLASYFITPAIFLQMWERCSPTIRHLVLSCHFHLSSPEAVRPVPTCRPPLVGLESLQIVSVDYLRDWLMHDLCPSDFSRLKLLSFWYAHGAVLRSARFAAALRNLEVFDLVLWQSDDTLDLSTLPNLRLLRMRPMSDSVQIILATLSMIPATSCIRRILLHSMYLAM
ncbi:hypothetical protein FB451DRAFT_184890 [Mycena latifolia]|nr:hypothetical protein FB451DRAFT_184890 [Mycena latifolia]